MHQYSTSSNKINNRNDETLQETPLFRKMKKKKKIPEVLLNKTTARYRAHPDALRHKIQIK